MKITFLGGANEVGASSLLVETSGQRVLIDCGIRPSPKSHSSLAPDQLPNLSQIEQAGGKLDAILVTHAHTDHTGALELVIGRFPEIPVYATAPTLELIRVLHQDSRRIMQSRLDEEGELPLFDDLAVERLVAALVPVPFQTRLPIGEGLAATFFPAGHIAGAAMIGLESEEGRLLISGDLSISAQRSVDGARKPDFYPDALILESTYGGRLHANRAVQERKLVKTVAEVTALGGKVLIPAFALGRAQEILLILNEYMQNGQLAPVPVWADGMVRAICQAYPLFGDALPLPLQEQNAQFFNSRIRAVQNAEQRNRLIWEPGAAVIVASSGMLAGGPSLSYARALAPKPEHAILLTGYQDEESPGRRLQELGEKGTGTIRLGTDKIDVRCRLATYSLSAHADEAQLISLTETLDPEHVLLVHGDLPARQSLEKAISQRGRIVHLPEAGQTIELTFEKHARFIRPNPSDDPRHKKNELARQRHTLMPVYAGAVGKWLLLKSDPSIPVRCLAVAPDHLWVEMAPGLEQAAYPETILAVFGETQPAPNELRPYQSEAPVPGNVAMEPNQALAFANQHFPIEARLRKCGYHLDQQILALTFDFPDSASQTYDAWVESLQTATGWVVEINPETNLSSLTALIRELLPDGTQIVKGPAFHREQKKVFITVTQTGDDALNSDISNKFRIITGWELALTFKALEASRTATTMDRFSSAPIISAAKAGTRLEINAAHNLIKTALEGSSLYRTSLKDDKIILSFISPQVGERYANKISVLEGQTGWALVVNPQPNQGSILEIARALVNKAGLVITKGPSIFPEKAEVTLTLMADSGQIAALSETFLAQTGFRLVVNLPQTSSVPPNVPGASPKVPAASTIVPGNSSSMTMANPAVSKTGPELQAPALINIVEIPLKRIRLNSYQQSLSLNPAKLEKAVQRARIMGINPPIQVRRLQDGYVLTDGLYRLCAAETLGLERIPAVVEPVSSH
jgi:uncharacterized protein